MKVIRSHYTLLENTPKTSSICESGRRVRLKVLKLFPKVKNLALTETNLLKVLNKLDKHFWYLVGQALLPWMGKRAFFQLSKLDPAICIKVRNTAYNIIKICEVAYQNNENADRTAQRIMAVIEKSKYKFILRLR